MEKNIPGDRSALQTIGYKLYSYGSGIYWPDIPMAGVHCQHCYRLHDSSSVSDQVRMPRRYDVAYTLDTLRIIVSERFRAHCQRNDYDDIVFRLVDRRKSLYELRPSRILKLDLDRSLPLFSNYCIHCERFKYVHLGRGFFFSGIDAPLADGFYRSDMPVSGENPIIVVGTETMKKLKAAGFKRMVFQPVPHFQPRYLAACAAQVPDADSAETHKQKHALSLPLPNEDWFAPYAAMVKRLRGETP